MLEKRQVLRSPQRSIPFATHLELIFWRIIPIFARSKSLWGIAISQRLQFTSTYQKNIFPQLKVLLMAVVRMTELQDIFRHVKLKPLSPDQAKAFHIIRLCRTSALGSHAQVCQECGSTDVSFNSCRNRHCPKCQHSAQEEWVEAQMSKLLPVGYFHTVFTIPQELNTLVFQNQKLLYSLLIKSEHFRKLPMPGITGF